MAENSTESVDPGQNKLQAIKNRRSSMKANLTKKIKITENYIEGRKNRKLIELALTQLNTGLLTGCGKKKKIVR